MFSLFFHAHIPDGHFLCPGNVLSIKFYGEERQFTILRVTSSKPSSSHQSVPKPLEDSLTDDLSNLSLTETTPTKVSMVTICEATSTPVRGDLSSLELAGHGGEDGGVLKEALPDKVVGTPDVNLTGSVATVASLGVYKVTLKTGIMFEQGGRKSNWVC